MSRKPGQASHIKPLTPEEHQRLIRCLQQDDCPSIKMLVTRFKISAAVIAKLRREVLSQINAMPPASLSGAPDEA